MGSYLGEEGSHSGEGSYSGELSTYDASTSDLITDVADKVKVYHCQRVSEYGFPLHRGAEVKHVLIRGRDPPVGLVPARREKDIAGEVEASAVGLRERETSSSDNDE